MLGMLRMRYLAGVSAEQLEQARRSKQSKESAAGGSNESSIPSQESGYSSTAMAPASLRSARWQPLMPLPALLLSVLALVACSLLLIFSKDRMDSKDSQFEPLTEVRWGIVGCGDVTEKKSGPAFQLVRGSKLVMVMRRNASLAANYAERHGVARWTTVARQLIEDSMVNAVYIATPPRYHAMYAIMAARAGKPAYVEKPMAMSHRESAAMIREFKKANLPLFVAYYRRALPHFLRIKELIESGIIGNILTVHVAYHRPPNKYDYQWQLPSADEEQSKTPPSSESPSHAGQQGGRKDILGFYPAGSSLSQKTLKWRTDPLVGGIGGYFRDKGSHQLDLLQYWFGAIVSVSGASKNSGGLYPADDTMTAHFKFVNGVMGTGSWCFVASNDGQQEYGEIIGSGGKIRFQFFKSNKVEIWNQTGFSEFEIPSPPHVQQPLIEKVVAELRGEGKSPSTGETAMVTDFVMDTIVQGQKWP